MSPEEATWEATRLNIVLANKGYSDSDVTRWWNFTRHAELDDQTIAEAWKAGEYAAVSRLIESLPDKHGAEQRRLLRRVGGHCRRGRRYRVPSADCVPVRMVGWTPNDPTTTRTEPKLEAGAIVAAMTADEKLWCLDGDAPFWAGLAYLAESGYHKSPFRAARWSGSGCPGSPSPTATGGGRRSGHLLPGQHGPGCHLGHRPRGADRRRHRSRSCAPWAPISTAGCA